MPPDTPTADPNRAPGQPWTVAQGAAYLGVSSRTLFRLIHAGQVKVARLNRRVLVPDAEIRRLATEGCR